MTISNNASALRPGVCTSSTRPTTPYEGQYIHETDTDKILFWNGSTWYAPWDTAWGIILNKTETSTNVSFASETTTLTTASFTAVANRSYKITYSEPSISLVSGTVNGVASIIRLTNISGTVLYIQDAVTANMSLTNASVFFSFITTLSAGSTILNASMGTAGGGTARANRSSTRYAYLSIEDIGVL